MLISPRSIPSQQANNEQLTHSIGTSPLSEKRTYSWVFLNTHPWVIFGTHSWVTFHTYPWVSKATHEWVLFEVCAWAYSESHSIASFYMGIAK